MDIAAAGSLLMFFALCVLQVLLGALVFSYAAHSFLTILINTAAGDDEVAWPDEPMYDWLWKPWYLAWLVFVWLAPVALVLGLLTLSFWKTALVGLVLFWLLFPVCLLSSLSAASSWVVLNGRVVAGLFRHLTATAVFYAATEMLLAAVSAAVYGAVRFPGWMLATPVLALTAAVVLFLYGRLVGRLAWVMNHRDLGRRTATEEEPEPTADAHDPWTAPGDETRPRAEPTETRRKTPPKAYDPWAAPPKQEDPEAWKRGLTGEARRAGTYRVQKGEPPPPPPRPEPKQKKRRPAVYAAQPAELKKPEESVVPEIPQRELELASPHREGPPPRLPMVSGVYSFPAYSNTIGPLLTVALGLWLMGLVLLAQLSFLGPVQ